MTELFGKPLSYWIELDKMITDLSSVRELDISKLVQDNMRMRAKVNFIEQQRREADFYFGGM